MKGEVLGWGEGNGCVHVGAEGRKGVKKKWGWGGVGLVSYLKLDILTILLHRFKQVPMTSL